MATKQGHRSIHHYIISKTLIFLLSLSIPLTAQDLNKYLDIKVSLSKNVVYIYEPVEIRIKISYRELPVEDIKITPPESKDFNIAPVYEENTTEIINFTLYYSKQYTYQITPLKFGKITIPSFSISIKLNGKTIEKKTKPVDIIVIKGDKKYQVAWIELYTSKDTCFVGEPIIFEVKVKSTRNIVSVIYNQSPDFRDFLVRELYANARVSTKMENGMLIWEYSFLQSLIIPLTPGLKVLSNVNVTMVIQDLYSSDTTKLEITSGEKRITVKPLPVNVGKEAPYIVAEDLKYDVNIGEKEKKLNTPSSLFIKFSGYGSVFLLPRPFAEISTPEYSLSFLSSKDNISITADKKVSSTKVFEYVLIPKKTGEIKLTNFTFSYFDLKTQKVIYKTIQLPSIKVIESRETEKKEETTYTPNGHNLLPKQKTLFIILSLSFFLIVVSIIIFVITRRKRNIKPTLYIPETVIEGLERAVNKEDKQAFLFYFEKLQKYLSQHSSDPETLFKDILNEYIYVKNLYNTLKYSPLKSPIKQENVEKFILFLKNKVKRQ